MRFRHGANARIPRPPDESVRAAQISRLLAPIAWPFPRVRAARQGPAGPPFGRQKPAPIPLKPPRTRRRQRAPEPTSTNGGDPAGTPVKPAKPKVKKLRLALVMLGLSAL